MHKSVLTALLIFLSLFGIADSWYIYQNEASQAGLACSIQGFDGCNTVAQSKYSELLGVPLALYGAVFYSFLFALAALIAVLPSRGRMKILFALAGAGALASLVFSLIQVVVIKAVCVYCFASAVTSFLIFGFAYWLLKRFAPGRLAVVA